MVLQEVCEQLAEIIKNGGPTVDVSKVEIQAFYNTLKETARKRGIPHPTYGQCVFIALHEAHINGYLHVKSQTGSMALPICQLSQTCSLFQHHQVLEKHLVSDA